jgi:ligand-binding sensor domain-containing protein
MNQGSPWLSTNHGLRIPDDLVQDARRPRTHGLIGAIVEDHRGNGWLGTVSDGPLLLHDGQETTSKAPAALPNNSISALLEDQEENI